MPAIDRFALGLATNALENMRCPCRKKRESETYAECCEPYHTGQRVAPTAEALMRSRYSAFALKNAAYLTETWHGLTRPPSIRFNPGQEWSLLRVIAAHEDGDKASVEFVAKSRVDGSPRELHEVSRFVREDGRWYYVDGVIDP